MLKFDITCTLRDEQGDHTYTRRNVSLTKARAVERKHRRCVAGKIAKRGHTTEPCRPGGLKGWTTAYTFSPGGVPVNYYPGAWGFSMSDGIPFGIHGTATIKAGPAFFDVVRDNEAERADLLAHAGQV